MLDDISFKNVNTIFEELNILSCAKLMSVTTCYVTMCVKKFLCVVPNDKNDSKWYTRDE